MSDEIVKSERKIDEVRRRQGQLIAFADKLGVEFKNINLLEEALTHSSYTKYENDKAVNNERLEFLGDAVIELITSAYLYTHFPNMSEGELTKARSWLVREESLAALASNFGFGRMMRFGGSENNETGRSRPSTLEDAFEAFVGALFLDRKMTVTKQFVEKAFAEGFEQLKRGEVVLNDAKSALQELIQRECKIEYVELNSFGPPHDRTFECAVKIDGKIFGRGIGKSKQAAEKIAAGIALKAIEDEMDE